MDFVVDVEAYSPAALDHPSIIFKVLRELFIAFLCFADEESCLVSIYFDVGSFMAEWACQH
jgi:hypothetical protein